MVNFLTIKDGSGTSKQIFAVEDGTSTFYTQHVISDVSGNIPAVVSGAQAAGANMGALVVALSPNSPIPSGTNLIGAVSVKGNIIGAVSIANIADVSVQDNATVSVRNTITVGTHAVTINAGSNLIGAVSVRGNILGAVSIANIADVSIQDNAVVSVRNTLTVNTHAVTQSGTWAVNAALTSTNNNVALTSVGSNPVPIGAGTVTQALRVVLAGNNTDKTVVGAVSVGQIVSVVPDGTGANFPVSVANTITVGTHAVTQSGTWNVNAALTSTNNNVALTSVGTNPVPIGAGTVTQALRVVLAGNNTDKVIIGAVSLADVDSGGAIRTTSFNFTSQYVFTRPNDSTAYTGPTGISGSTAGNAGDLVANSTTNTAVKPLKFAVGRVNGGVAYVRKARLFRTGTTISGFGTLALFKLHLFNTNNEVSVVNGDNGSLLVSPVSAYLGYFLLTSPVSASIFRTNAGTTTTFYHASPIVGSEMVVTLSANQVSIQGVLEAQGAYTPTANEIYTVIIDGFQT